MTLLNAQEMALQSPMASLRVGALFMEPGTGKTGAAIELIRSTGATLCIWLCPFQTKESTANEIAKRGGVGIETMIEGVESLSQSDTLYLRLISASDASTVIVMDESIKIKNHEAIRTRRATEIAKRCGYRLILNGTPTTRDLLDLWAQMQFLSPLILGMDYARFKATYCETVKKIVKGRVVDEWVVRHHNIDHLQAKIAPYVFGWQLQLEVGQVHAVIPFQLTTEQQEQYKETKHAFLNPKTMEAMNGNVFLAMCQKLQQGYSVSEDKATVLRQHIGEGQGCLIFCKFVAASEFLVEAFPEAQVLTYGKGSLGLNLQDRHVTVFWERTWDYAQMLQAIARTYRTGQQHDCTYLHMAANSKLDALIAGNIDAKRSLLDDFKIRGNQLMEEL